MCVLITGSAGFIGFHLTKKLLQQGHEVIGFDNINDYYDPSLKKARLDHLKTISQQTNNTFKFVKGSLEDKDALKEIFCQYNIKKVVNLAAQAGVRYSIENPSAYIQSNLVGFCHLLEECRNNDIKHLVYASSSSVYGGNKNLPFSEKHGVDHPVSLYAASKKANELMAHTYSHLYGIPATGLRFFTVYGPWGRPDMALFLFTKAMINNEAIKIFNEGQMIRDFTYIDDIIESLIRVLAKPAEPNPSFNYMNPDPSTSWCSHRVFNIGNSSPTPLMEYISALENALGIKAKKEFLPMQPGDVSATAAETRALEDWVGFKPSTPIAEGVQRFVEWYRDFYKI